MRKYFYWSGVVANLALLGILLIWARSIYWLGLPLPLYSQKVAADLRVNYPSVAFVAPLFDFFGRFEQKNYLFRELDPTQWHGAGAHPDFTPAQHGGQIVVTDVASLKKALSSAKPGQQIMLEPGVYAFERTFEMRQAGTAEAPIRLTGRRMHQVQLLLKGEGLLLLAPHWQFENLSFIGDCDMHDRCQHALHISGKASDVVVRNNSFRDFNSAIKVNGLKGNYPDRGLLESNTIYNTSPRQTKGPATPVDIVAANDWVVRANFIFDIQKNAGDEVSYAGFIKGNASGGVFERNLVMCEANLKGGRHNALGLSFGGGGTGAAYHRDGVTGTETTGGVMRNNIIMHCPNDVGIYLNNAKDSLLENNIVYNTVGVDVRYSQSSALLSNNVISGRVNNREGGQHQLESNLILARDFFTGRDKLKDYFVAPDLGDFSWTETYPEQPAAQRNADGQMQDFCGAVVQKPYLGAFAGEEFCIKPGKTPQ